MYFWNVKRFTLPQMPSEKHSNVIRYSAHGEKSGRWPAAANTRSVLAHTNCFDYRHLLSTKFRSYQLDTRTEPMPRTTWAENGCRGFFFPFFSFFIIVGTTQVTAEMNQSTKLKAAKSTSAYLEEDTEFLLPWCRKGGECLCITQEDPTNVSLEILLFIR